MNARRDEKNHAASHRGVVLDAPVSRYPRWSLVANALRCRHVACVPWGSRSMTYDVGVDCEVRERPSHVKNATWKTTGYRNLSGLPFKFLQNVDQRSSTNARDGAADTDTDFAERTPPGRQSDMVLKLLRHLPQHAASTVSCSRLCECRQRAQMKPGSPDLGSWRRLPRQVCSNWPLRSSGLQQRQY